MVTTMCVYCGDSVMDATPDCDDIEKWYAKNHPNLSVSTRITDVCPDCKYRYTAGEQIVTRCESDSTRLVVTVVVRTSGLPDMIVGRHPDGRELSFAATQIRLVGESSREDNANDSSNVTVTFSSAYNLIAG